MQTIEPLQTKLSDTILKFQVQYYFPAWYLWILVGSQAWSKTTDTNVQMLIGEGISFTVSSKWEIYSSPWQKEQQCLFQKTPQDLKNVK